MKLLQRKLREARENKKGFTLVEIVVVLVIIAILATLMLGAYNGYIDKAKEKTLTADTRSLYLAAQTIVAEKYADGTLNSGTTSVSFNSIKNEVLKLADLETKSTTTYKSINVTIENGKVTSATMKDKATGKTCTITASTGKAEIS